MFTHPPLSVFSRCDIPDVVCVQTHCPAAGIDLVLVVGGVLSLIIILIIGVSALVFIILLIKNQNLKAMLKQAKE